MLADAFLLDKSNIIIKLKKIYMNERLRNETKTN